MIVVINMKLNGARSEIIMKVKFLKLDPIHLEASVIVSIRIKRNIFIGTIIFITTRCDSRDHVGKVSRIMQFSVIFKRLESEKNYYLCMWSVNVQFFRESKLQSGNKLHFTLRGIFKIFKSFLRALELFKKKKNLKVQ